MTSLGCGSQKPVNEQSLVETFETLHRSVYDVYALGPNRDSIHKLLASVFQGPELTEQYIEHYTTLAAMELQETAIDVLKIDYESVTVLPDPVVSGIGEMFGNRSFRNRSPGIGEVRVEVDWSVGGVVTHQQHRHARVNRYRAVYTLVPKGDSFRIVATRLRNLERVSGVLSGAAGFPLDNVPTSARGFLTAEDLFRSGVADDLLDDPSSDESTIVDQSTADLAVDQLSAQEPSEKVPAGGGEEPP